MRLGLDPHEGHLLEVRVLRGPRNEPQKTETGFQVEGGEPAPLLSRAAPLERIVGEETQIGVDPLHVGGVEDPLQVRGSGRRGREGRVRREQRGKNQGEGTHVPHKASCSQDRASRLGRGGSIAAGTTAGNTGTAPADPRKIS